MRPIVAACIVLLAPVGAQAADRALMRFPDIHGDEVVFSYAGDLWLATTDGGTPRQLTSGPGLKLFPKFSPDGQWIAFTGQYGGDEQVYVMPAKGGVARQLTFYPARGPLPARSGYDNQVTGWRPDGSAILFRSLRDVPTVTEARLYTVPAAGGEVVPLPMARAGAGVFSPDGGKVLFSTTSRDFRAWKRYQGGWAQDLFIADLSSRSLTNITHNVRTDRDPMWTRRGIFFLSDRDGHLNLYQTDVNGGTVRKLTNFTAGDAEWASADAEGNIVFQYEGTLHVYRASANAEQTLALDIPAGDGAGRPRTVRVGGQVEDSALSPDGRRVAVVARGDIFLLPADGPGPALNLTHSSNAHERAVAWAPNGRSLAFVSDRGGDEELWVMASDGSGVRAVTRDSHTRYYRPVWSPDGRRVAVLDKDGGLFAVDLATGTRRPVGATRAWFQRDYEWSPDGRYLTYAEMQASNLRAIHIWDAETGRNELVTDTLYDSFNPAWSPDGRYLWFLSVRDPNLQVAEGEWNYAGNRQTRLYALALRPDVPNPFMPPNLNEDTKEGQRSFTDGAAAKASGNDKGGKKRAAVDYDGLAQRLIQAPAGPDNYVDLVAAADRLVFRLHDAWTFGEEEGHASLFSLPFKGGKPVRVVDAPQGYEVDAARTTALIQGDHGQLMVAHLDAGGGLAGGPKPVELDRLVTTVNPREEWAEIFDEVWRRYRDFFYDPGMQGHDWKAIGAHYRALLPAVSNRADLNYLIGEMIAELNISHAYVAGGDEGLPPRPWTGLLGARFTFDPAVGLWRVAKVFEGDNADPQYRSPFTEVGSRVGVGDYILAIDGRPLDAAFGPDQALVGKADQMVEVAVGRSRTIERRVLVKTLHSETALIRQERKLDALRLVDRLSGGRIGYVHISDMGPAGLAEFVKDWYGQLRKDGIVIDIRGNGGGNVSRMILERLLRPAYSRGFVRGLQIPQTYPWGNFTQVFTGEMAMLVNENTMSDGDTMAWTFQQTHRGPLIGKRTWGGVIGGGDTGPLLDGGSVTVPQFALAGPHGEWIVEGQGVTPDIEVDFDQAALKGAPDAQLTAAVQNLLDRIKGNPGSLGGPQPYPIRP
ncbi:S41 family peptidase [Nitrospirillum pindoramense]|uniref:S41 family peptidase n=1 Tax=Nitrospirillum amazonense TaxID=28077 RepID=UPI0011A2F982|nr:S41 family peptidase [Nitrospirillum amazonense]